MLITLQTAAKILGMSVPGATYALRAAKVKEIRIGNCIRFDQADIEKFASERAKKSGASDIIGTAEVAKMLAVSDFHVTSLASTGYLPHERSGRIYIFRRSEIEELIANGGIVKNNTKKMIENATDLLKDPSNANEEPEDQPETNDDIKPWDVELDKEKEYFTKDIWEAAVLVAAGDKCLRAEKNQTTGSFCWVFADTDFLRDTLNAHYKGALLQKTKNIKESHISLKEMLKK